MSKLNIHGVVDGAAKLLGAAIWERRQELLQVANLPPNLSTRLNALRPTGPVPFQGQFLDLARQAATERKESKDLREVTDASKILSKLDRIERSGKNFLPKKPFYKRPQSNLPARGRGAPRNFPKNQGDRRNLYIRKDTSQAGSSARQVRMRFAGQQSQGFQNTAQQPQTKDQNQRNFYRKPRGGGNGNQQL
jgi:hypothetical protein